VIFGINTTCDISKLSQISLAWRLVKLRITISKYHSWYLCQISLQIMLLPIQTWEITCEWQNYSFVSNKHACLLNNISNVTVTNNKNELWKTVRLEQVFKDHNCNLFQSPPCLPIHSSFCICCAVLFIPRCALSRYFYVQFTPFGRLPLFECWLLVRDTAPKTTPI